MELETECLVSGPLVSVLRLARWMGLAPLTFINTQDGWRIRLSTAYSVYGYVLIILLNIWGLVTMIHNPSLSFILLRSTYIFHMVGTGLSVYRARGQVRMVMSCLNHLQKIYDLLDLNQSPERFKKISMILMYLWLPICLVLTISDVCLLLYQNTDNNVAVRAMYSFYSCCFFIIKVHELYFIVMMVYVTMTFIDINKIIRNVFDDRFLPSAPTHYKTVRQVSLAYTFASDVVSQLNKSFGMMLLLFLVINLINLIVTPYYLIQNLASDQSDGLQPQYIPYISFIILSSAWTFHHGLNVLLIIEPCHITHVEMNKTRKLISRLVYYGQSIHEPLSRELDQFQRHLTLNRASYFALGVVMLTRPFVLTIFASSATYLAVVLQLYPRSK